MPELRSTLFRELSSMAACFKAEVMGCVALMWNWQTVADLYCLVKCTDFFKK